MSAEALAQLRGEAVVDRRTIRIVGIHIAEWDTVVKRSWIAVRVEALTGKAALNLLCQLYAGATSAEQYSGGDRGIQSTGAEEVHHRCAHPGSERTDAARD